jgi:hypothetical protein
MAYHWRAGTGKIQYVKERCGYLSQITWYKIKKKLMNPDVYCRPAYWDIQIYEMRFTKVVTVFCQ